MAHFQDKFKFFMWQNGLCISYLLRFKQIEQFFIANDWEVTEDPREADLCIIGACASFIPFFKKYADKIKELSQIDNKMVVYGCLPMVDPDYFKKTTPERAIYIPITMPERFETVLDDVKVPFSKIPDSSEFRKEDNSNYDPDKRYISVQEGCSEGCIFCPHKIGIGKEKSRPYEDIIEQVKRCVAEVAKTIAFEGNNCGSWGLDLDPPQTFETLAAGIIKASGDCELCFYNFAPKWISLYPNALCHPRIIEIKIPIQTVSARLLTLMGRDPHIKEMSPILKELKSKNERLKLRTEIIIGFPTETIEEVMETLDWVSEYFEKIAVYSYDYHPNTEIAKMNMPFLSDGEVAERILLAFEYFKNKPNVRVGFNMGKVVDQFLKCEHMDLK